MKVPIKAINPAFPPFRGAASPPETGKLVGTGFLNQGGGEFTCHLASLPRSKVEIGPRLSVSFPCPGVFLLEISNIGETESHRSEVQVLEVVEHDFHCVLS